MTELELMETNRREGTAQCMVRGDGAVLGWYVIERLVRNHTFPSATGIGQVINFEALFVRVPTPSGLNEFPVLWQAAMATVPAT
jgi:phage protein U